jgi:cellulose biosynthesis protein BcsQ
MGCKTKSATNIALGIASVMRSSGASRAQVLLIDTDSQAHATLVTTGRKDFDTTSSLYAVLVAERADAPRVMARCIVQSTWDEDLHVLSEVDKSATH